MYCRQCATPLPEASEFCHKCGTPVNASIAVPRPDDKLPASELQRLANYLLDRFFRSTITIVIFVIAVSYESKILYVLGSVIFLGYYIFSESIWQKTLGKLITGTKVVNYDGTKPGFWRIVGRSLSRLIPFDHFSFLFGRYPIGWHDSISKTLVVPKDLTPLDVGRMNLQEIKKIKSESVFVNVIIIIFAVLFVMAFLGILTSVVLASINSARMKANHAQIESTLLNVRVKAEEYKIAHGNYLDVCKNPEISSLFSSLVNSAPMKVYSDTTCNDSKEAYAANASILSNSYDSENPPEYFCIDSTGVASRTVSNLFTNSTKCEIISPEFNEIESQLPAIKNRDFLEKTETITDPTIGEEMKPLAEELMKIANTDTEKALANAWMASTELKFGKTKEALQYIDTSLALNDRSVGSYMTKSLIYREMEDFDSALPVAEQCLEIAKEKESISLEDLCESEIAMVYHFRSKNGSKFQENDLTEAEKHMQRAIELDPYNIYYKSALIEIIISRAFYDAKNKNFVSAIASLDTLIRQNDKYKDGYLLSREYSVRGVIKSDSGDYKGAIVDLEKSLEMYPADDEAAMHDIGNQYDNLNQPDKAIEWYEKSLALDPEDTNYPSNEKTLRDMINLIFNHYDILGEIEANKKMAELRTRLIAYNPKDILDQYELRAIAYEMANEYQKAADAYLEYLSVYKEKGEDPEDVSRSTLERVASMQYHLGQYKESCSNLKKAEVLHEKLKLERVNHYSWDFRHEIEDDNGNRVDLVNFCKNLK